MKTKKRVKGLSSKILAVLMVLAMSFTSFAAMAPADFSATLEPMQTTVDPVTVNIPTMPPKADVIFSFDLTGSMGSILGTAKTRAMDMMNQLNATGVDINYGVVSYMDYNGTYTSYGYSAPYGTSADYPYKLNKPLTNSTADVSNAINGLTLGNGYDAPECYARPLYESYSDTNIGWRSGARKIFVNFGDAVPHDNNLNEGVTSGIWSTGGDPGRDAIMGTADDIDLQAVLAQMAANNIVLLECHSSTANSNYWDHWTGITGGHRYLTTSSTMAADVVNAISSLLAAPNVENLHLIASTGYESWLATVNPMNYTGPTGVTTNFDATLTVPEGTTAGVYNFKLIAVDKNNVAYGEQNVTITVPDPNRPPVANAGPDQVVDATGPDGATVVLDGTLSSDPDGDALTYSWVGPFGTSGDKVAEVKMPIGKNTVQLTVSDGKETSVDTVDITVNGLSKLTVEATPVEYSDKTNITAVLTSFGAPLAGKPVEITVEGLGTYNVTTNAEGKAVVENLVTLPQGNYNVTAKFADEEFLKGSQATNNVAVSPEKLTSIAYTGDMLKKVTETVTLSAKVEQEDDGLAGDYTKAGVKFELYKTNADGTITLAGTYDATCDAIGNATTTQTLPIGVYNVRVKTVSEGYFTEAKTESMVVVYDPNGGFATGGGFINVTDPTMGNLGRANFGFNSKYKNGASVGNLEFQYKDGGVNLKSTTIDWMTISATNAQFQGTGAIEGREGVFTFRVNCTDNDKNDKFTIKVWQGTDTNSEPIYKAINVDLAGGNIVVHK